MDIVPTSRIGTVLSGHYRLDRLIGEGAMGAVYAATRMTDGSTCAVKVLHAEYVQHATITRRFFGEAEAMARLEHPGIARVFEAARAEDGAPYLVMELLEGRPLSDALAMSGPLPLPFAIRIMKTALEALGYAHEHGVVHRDLKPDNLFVLTLPGQAPTLKIVDFGIAKILDDATTDRPLTRTGAMLGTPGYMAPEQLRSSRDVDPRSDLWSMAVILYEVLSGKDPFVGDNAMAQIHSVMQGEPVPIGDVAPQVAGLQGFFNRGFAHDRAARFQTATEMIEALEFFADRAHELPPPPSRVMSVRALLLAADEAGPSSQLPPSSMYPPASVGIPSSHPLSPSSLRPGALDGPPATLPDEDEDEGIEQGQARSPVLTFVLVFVAGIVLFGLLLVGVLLLAKAI
jgi:serine/threonine-protein kinase